MAVINLTAKQAATILKAGRDRAEGVVIKVDDLLKILQKGPMTTGALFKLLDKDAALSMTLGDSGAPGDHITFSKKVLSDISEGIAVKKLT